MARNEFRLRSALGGLMAADEDLLNKETQKLENQNRALRAVALVDQVKRDRAFAARERQAALDLQKQKLISVSRDNRIGEMYDEDLAAAELQKAQGQGRIAEEKANLLEEFGREETIAGIKRTEAGTAKARVETAAIPQRLGIARERLGLEKQRIALDDRRVAVSEAGEARRQQVYDDAENVREYKEKVAEWEMRVKTANSPDEVAALELERKKLDNEYLKARARMTELRATTGAASGVTGKGITAGDKALAESMLMTHPKLADTNISKDDTAKIQGRLATIIAALRSDSKLTGSRSTDWGNMAVERLWASGEIGRTPSLLPFRDDSVEYVTPGTPEALESWLKNNLGAAKSREEARQIMSAYETKFNRPVPAHIADMFRGTIDGGE